MYQSFEEEKTFAYEMAKADTSVLSDDEKAAGLLGAIREHDLATVYRLMRADWGSDES